MVTYPTPTFHNTNVPFLHGREWSNSRVQERLLVKFVHAVNRGIRFQTCKTFHKMGSLMMYTSPNIARVIQSRIMRWTGNVARMREIRGVHRI